MLKNPVTNKMMQNTWLFMYAKYLKNKKRNSNRKENLPNKLHQIEVTIN